MYVYFVPTAAGTLNGNVTINDNGFFNQVNTVSLTGPGSAISLTGSPLSFGNQLVKTTSAAKIVTVKNNGTTSITMGTITLTKTTDYAISANTCPASGSTLHSRIQLPISVTFGPKSRGRRGARWLSWMTRSFVAATDRSDWDRNQQRIVQPGFHHVPGHGRGRGERGKQNHGN